MQGVPVTETQRKLRILTIDDHPLFRQGVAAVINARQDMEVIAEGANGLEAVELYRRYEPDVVIMDLRMPALAGVEAISIITSEFPNARILVMTTYQGDVEALRALKAGARGYLLKSAIAEDVAHAIDRVSRGHKYVPSAVAVALADHAVDGALSTREIEVLRLIASGNSNLAAAHALSISEETVKSHMKSIIAKLNAKDRTHAVMIAVRRGILTD
jgi:DNA-binding NarL/FixJ family response regulator